MKPYAEPDIKIIVAEEDDILTMSGPKDDTYSRDIFGFYLN